jgi:phosphomannomutase
VISDQLKSEVLDWIDNDPDEKTANQLTQWLKAENKTELERCFAGFLQFGTAGLRGPIGPGPSCINRAVVSRTATGILAFMKKNNLSSVVIGRDARHGSEEFAKDSAEIFAGGGMKTYVLPRVLPTPVLAFALNKLKADVGIMVTASHNPANDNGYKVYLGGVFDGVNYRGSQIISPIDTQISELIEKAEKRPVRNDRYEIVNESVIDQYVLQVAKLATKPNNLKVVYTPLHGVGAETFINVFEKSGFKAPIVVKEQVTPDPDFPTTAFPNPEEAGAIDLALGYAKENNADLVIANDPDADRCAVAISDPANGWRMLRGDEVGALLGHYLISNNSVRGVRIANSLVSSSLLGKIAKRYQLEFKETLTGFKWISKVEKLLFGYEEALGYCVDAKNVNDKDGISAAVVIVTMVAELKEKGLSISEYLEKIGQEYGFHSTDQISLRFSDLKQIDQLLNKVIDQPPAVLAGHALVSKENLNQSKSMPTPGIRLKYENEIRVSIRPSGTEPKLKCYIEVVAASKNEAESLISQIKQALTKVLT